MCKHIIRIIIFINIIMNFFKKNYYFTLIGFAAFILTFIPPLIFKIMKVKTNKSLCLSIIIFIFFALYLGTLNNFYRYNFWDTILHFSSVIIIGCFAFIILKKYCLQSSVNSPNQIFFFIFVLSFAALCGVIWEIYEFTMDTFFYLDMQKVESSGVTDTMIDLIAGLLGSVICYISHYFKWEKQ